MCRVWEGGGEVREREAGAKVGVSAHHALGISYLKFGHRKKPSRSHRVHSSRDASSSTGEWKCWTDGRCE